MDASRTARIARLEDQIWLLKVRTEEIRNELPSNPAGSQSRLDADDDLATIRAEIKGLVRERGRLEAIR
jgi:hypothetical protein